jgi:hypothetical protein
MWVHAERNKHDMTRLSVNHEKQKDADDQEKKLRAIMVSHYTAMMNASQIKSKPAREERPKYER